MSNYCHEKEIDPLDGLIRQSERIRARGNPSLATLDRLDRLESQIAAHCQDDPWYLWARTAYRIKRLDEGDFWYWLLNHSQGDVIGIASDRYECVIHRYLRHHLGLAAEDFHVGVDDVRPALDWGVARSVPLPPWAVQVTRLTTYPAGLTLTQDVAITAGWMRRRLGW